MNTTQTRSRQTQRHSNTSYTRIKAAPLLDPDFDKEDLWMQAVDWPIENGLTAN